MFEATSSFSLITDLTFPSFPNLLFDFLYLGKKIAEVGSIPLALG